MIDIILIWIYIIIISYVCGFAVINLLTPKEGFVPYHKETYLIAGYFIMIVYSELFSLFYKVGLLANLIILILTVIFAWVYRKQFAEEIKALFGTSSKTKFFVLVLFILFAYGTSKGYIHYDTDLYHAQSIRWIEEYGVVPGLGNIHTRLAYNSAAFCLSALFSMKFLAGQSYHTCAGLLAFVTALLCRNLFVGRRAFKPVISNFVRIVAIYYLFNIFDEMVSPASDYFVVLSIILIVMLFAEHIENEDKNATAYALLSLMSLIAMSIKISGALIVLLAIYPAVLLIRNKDFKGIAKYILLGIMAIAPFFARNIILSGYLIYPVTGIDIFDFKFKIPKGIAEYDAKEVQVYGRGHIDVTRYDEKLSEWLPGWLDGLDAINKISFCLAVIAIIILIFCIGYMFYKHKYDMLGNLFILCVLCICFSFMIMTSPNIRFGCVFLWMFPITTIGYMYSLAVKSGERYILFSAFIALFMVYKIWGFTGEFVREASLEYIVHQQDYGEYEVRAYDLDGVTIYCPIESDRTGYNYFPSVPTLPEAKLIDKNIKNGFMSK